MRSYGGTFQINETFSKDTQVITFTMTLIQEHKILHYKSILNTWMGILWQYCKMQWQLMQQVQEEMRAS